MECLQCSVKIEKNGQVYVVGDMGPEIITLLEQSLGPAFNKNGRICSQCFSSITKLLSESVDSDSETLSAASTLSVKSEAWVSDDDAAAPARASPAPVGASAPPVRASVASVSASAAPVHASAVPVRASAAPVRASVTPVRANAVPVRASVVPVRASAVPVRASVVPVRASVVPMRASVVPVRANAAPVLGGRVAPVIRIRAAPVRASMVPMLGGRVAPVIRARIPPELLTSVAPVRDSAAPVRDSVVPVHATLASMLRSNAAPVIAARDEPLLVARDEPLLVPRAAPVNNQRACGKSVSGKKSQFVATAPKQMTKREANVRAARPPRSSPSRPSSSPPPRPPNSLPARPPSSPPPRARRSPDPLGLLSSPMRKRPKYRPLDSNEKTVILNIYKFIQKRITTYPYKMEIVEQVAQIMGMSIASINRVLTEYKKTGRVKSPPPLTPRKSLLERDDRILAKIKQIAERLEANNEPITIDKVLVAYRKEVGVKKLCRSSMYRALKKLKVKLKSPATSKTTDNEQ